MQIPDLLDECLSNSGDIETLKFALKGIVESQIKGIGTKVVPVISLTSGALEGGEAILTGVVEGDSLDEIVVSGLEGIGRGLENGVVNGISIFQK